MTGKDAKYYASQVKGKYPLLRLWEAPSFEPNISWTVFVDLKNEHYQSPIVRRVVGGRMTRFTSDNVYQDVETEAMSSQNVQIDDRPLTQNELTHLNIHRQFTISNPPHAITGFDGTFFGIQIFAYFSQFSLRWWENGPSEWQEVTEWAQEMRQFLSHLLAEDARRFKDINQ